MPSKVYGILAAGRAYIAATDPSSEPAQIARETGCGLVAAPGDPAALAEAIAAMYDDPAMTREMGARARGSPPGNTIGPSPSGRITSSSRA